MNVITFQQLVQEWDEGVQGFLARLNGAAELCSLTVPWTCQEEGCKHQDQVSFKERLTMLQLVRGLNNILSRRRCYRRLRQWSPGSCPTPRW